jgi:hypothetical protein
MSFNYFLVADKNASIKIHLCAVLSTCSLAFFTEQGQLKAACLCVCTKQGKGKASFALSYSFHVLSNNTTTVSTSTSYINLHKNIKEIILHSCANFNGT